MTNPLSDDETRRLLELLSVPGPSGDEGAIADLLEADLRARADGLTVRRVGDNVLAWRGTPRVAIFAHTDTIGFTLGYDRKLIPLGGPHAADREKLVCTTEPLTAHLRTTKEGKDGADRRHNAGTLKRVRDAGNKKTEPTPGTRWVYGREPRIEGDWIVTPYLDDRAGVWVASEMLRRCADVAVAFTVGEEANGHGARVAADLLHRELGLTQALIADITWHTDDTPCGKGVVVSLRDQFAPRQRFLDRVLALAAESGVPHQREIQNAGSSDGGHILRSSVPMDWVFIGAPSQKPHTAREKAALADLAAMRDLYAYLADRL